MHTKRILDKIEAKLQDSSYAREELLADLNNLLYYISAINPLPSLQTTDDVSTITTATQISLPADYHCNLYRVENSGTSRTCKIVYNFKVLATMHDGLTVAGSVVDVAAENGILHYRKLPASPETLTLFYNREPDVLLDTDTSFPDCLPEHLHDPILISHILYDKFSEIEDGTESARTNTAFYWERFINGMQRLQDFYPNTSLHNTYQRFASRSERFMGVSKGIADNGNK